MIYRGTWAFNQVPQYCLSVWFSVAKQGFEFGLPKSVESHVLGAHPYNIFARFLVGSLENCMDK